MIINKGNILKLIITPILLLGLTGCFEHTNDACVDKASEINITYKSCKDKNKFLTETNLHIKDPENKSYYSSGEYLTEDESNRLNNNAINVQNNLEKIHNLKMRVAETLLSFLMYAALIIVPISLYKTMKRSEEGKPHKIWFNLSMFTIATAFTYFVTSSNGFLVNMGSAMNALGQVLFTTTETLLISEGNQRKSQINSYSKNEALKDDEALIKIGVCLSNNQKRTLERRQNGIDLSYEVIETKEGEEYIYNKLTSQQDVVDFYYEKNVPYVKFYDERTNKKISYTINKFGLIHSVNFANCGQITAANKKISSAVFSIMEDVKFNSIVHSAIKNKTLHTSWSEIEKAYKDKYMMTENAKLRLMYLGLIYLVEYKKGLVIGSVELGYDAAKDPDYLAGEQEYIDFDSSNLQSFLSKTDAIYENINESICITEADLVKETINDLEDFDTTSFISQYSCVNFDKDNGTLSASTTSNKIYDNSNKQEIDTNIFRLVNQTNPLVSESAEELISGYAEVDDLFIQIVDSIYSFQEDVAYIHNKGYFYQSELFHYINTQTNGYLSMYSELNDVLDISYSKALPNYASGDNKTESNLYSYKSGYINYFLTPLFEQTNLSQSTAPSNYSSHAIEIATDSSRFNVDKKDLVSVRNAETLFKTGLDSMTNVFNSVSKITCSDDETCAEKQKDFQGAPEMQRLSSDLKVGSALGFALGFGLKGSGMMIQASTKQSSENSTYKQGKKKKKKSHIKTIGNGIGSAINETGNLMIGSSVVAAISATIIDFQFKYEKLFLVFSLVFLVLYIYVLPFFIMLAYSAFLWTWKDSEQGKKFILYCFNATVYPYLFMLTLSIALFTNNLMRALIMKFMPTISSYTNFDSDTSSMILGLIGPLLQVILTFIITFALVYISFKKILVEVKPLVDSAIKGGFNNLEEFVNRNDQQKLVAKTLLINETLKKVAKHKQKDKE